MLLHVYQVDLWNLEVIQLVRYLKKIIRLSKPLSKIILLLNLGYIGLIIPTNQSHNFFNFIVNYFLRFIYNDVGYMVEHNIF